MEDTGLKSQLPCWAALALACALSPAPGLWEVHCCACSDGTRQARHTMHHSDPCLCVLTVWFTSQIKTHFPGRLTASFLPGSPHRSLHTHVATHTPPASGQPSTQSCPPGPGCICQPNTFLLNWEGFDRCSPFFLMTFQAIVFTDSMYMREAHILYLHFKSLCLFLRPRAFFPAHSTWVLVAARTSVQSSVTPRQRHTVCTQTEWKVLSAVAPWWPALLHGCTPALHNCSHGITQKSWVKSDQNEDTWQFLREDEFWS